MDSPIAQIGVPLAAAGVSAYAPRRGGAGVQAGLAALGGMQDYNINKQRMSVLKAQQEQSATKFGWEEQDFKHTKDTWAHRDNARSSMGSLVRGLSPSGANATGGQAPAAQASLQAAGLEAGQVPKPTEAKPLFNEQESAALMAMIENDQFDEVAKYVTMRSNQLTDEEAKTRAAGLPDSVHGTFKTRSGEYENVPKRPDTTMTDAEFWKMDPEGYKKYMAAKAIGSPGTPNFQQASGVGDPNQPNTPLRFNARTGAYEIAPLPAGVTGVGKVPTDPNRGARIERLSQRLAKGDNLTTIKEMASMKSDERAMIFDRVFQLNPDYDAADIQRQIKMEDQFTNGADGKSVQSFDQFIQHADRMVQAAQKTTPGGVPLINRSANWIKANITADESYPQLLVAMAAVGKEYEKFLLNQGALQDDDRKEIKKLLNGEMAFGQFVSVAQQMSHTAEAKLNSMNQRYARVRKKDLTDLFSPEAQQSAARLGVGLTPHADVAPRGGAPRGAAPGGPPATTPRPSGPPSPRGAAPPVTPTPAPAGRRTGLSKSGRPMVWVGPGPSDWAYTDAE